MSEGGNLPLALTLGLVFHIVDGVSATNALVASPVLALCVQELLPECGVVGGGGALLDNNLLPVIGDLVDDPLGGFAELEVVEGRNALGRDRDTMGGSSVGRPWKRGAHGAGCNAQSA